MSYVTLLFLIEHRVDLIIFYSVSTIWIWRNLCFNKKITDPSLIKHNLFIFTPSKQTKGYVFQFFYARYLVNNILYIIHIFLFLYVYELKWQYPSLSVFRIIYLNKINCTIFSQSIFLFIIDDFILNDFSCFTFIIVLNIRRIFCFV